MALKLTFGQAEAALADVNEIASAKRTAFQARLKNFLKLGLLPEMQQGKGRAALYCARDLVSFALILELTDQGLTPERAIQVVNYNPRIALSVAGALRSLSQADWRWARDSGKHLRISFFIGFDTGALNYLREREPHVGLMYGIGHLETTRRSFSSINMSVLLDDLTRALSGQGRQFLTDLDDWLEDDPQAKMGKLMFEDIAENREFLAKNDGGRL